ncbi:MAG: acetylxylan esterase [Kiritimatiellae bacterium]|nr:acetylxylan esterase [Kiritimatiellia bacterium]
MLKWMWVIGWMVCGIAWAEPCKTSEWKEGEGEIHGTVPELMVCADGRRVDSVALWETVRRPELLELFRKDCFGYNPVGRPADLRFEPDGADTVMPDGKMVRRKARIRFSGPGGSLAARVLAFLPKGRTDPAPTFLMVVNASGERKRWADETREQKHPAWPVEEIVARGYATVCYFVQDFDPDFGDGFTNGVHAVFQPDAAKRKDSDWAGLAAWAWGASRVMDWIETQPELDRNKVAVIGWSRGGKTALWAGANDTRFAYVISNDSGCGGAKLNRMKLARSEHIREITKNLGYWFCTNYRRFADREEELPFDQHQLVALIAPRLVYVGSSDQDDWAGPRAEFESAKRASPAWVLYGKKGLGDKPFPAAPFTAYLEGDVGYHLNKGPHQLNAYDWGRYLDFAAAHGW